MRRGWHLFIDKLCLQLACRTLTGGEAPRLGSPGRGQLTGSKRLDYALFMKFSQGGGGYYDVIKKDIAINTIQIK